MKDFVLTLILLWLIRRLCVELIWYKKNRKEQERVYTICDRS